MNKSIIEKTQAREFVVKYLYHLYLVNLAEDINLLKESDENMDADIEKYQHAYIEEDKEHPNNDVSPKVMERGQKIIKSILKNISELEQTISKSLNRRTFEKLDIMEKSILLLGAYELDMKTAPKSVIINEAINLSKSYCSKDSYTLINGVLDKIVKMD